jgi:N-acetylmuramic acid 6-phosphate etherase
VTAKKKKRNSQELESLGTEQRNAATADFDLWPSLEMVRMINIEDSRVAVAVGRMLPQIARAVDLITERILRGGRLIYVGTGTSGRIAALDAAELPPTFGVDSRSVQFIIAGGPKALAKATEAAEDSREMGKREMARRKPTENDVVIGIAASGRTPFTIAAVEYARSRGAVTFALVGNRNSPLEAAAEHPIVIEVGPEVVAGSSRMKAGTAQKMALNMISTAVMTRLGHVYGNLMVNVHPKNSKLVGRAVVILEQAASVERSVARRTLQRAGNSVPVALVMLKAGVDRDTAKECLKAKQGNVREAISAANRSATLARTRSTRP